MSRRVDPAVAQARAVVGLYGDPAVTWSIMFELDLAQALATDALARRLTEAVAGHPHLGRPPQLRRFATAAEHTRLLTAFADTAYGDQDPLVRVGLDDGGSRLVVAGHHGALDGLGLVGLAARLLDAPLGSSARGRERTGGGPGFLASSTRRLAKAVVAPPVRFPGTRIPGARGDWLLSAEVSGPGLTSSDLVGAVSRVFTRQRPGRGEARAVFALGVSHRPGTPPLVPTRDTAYLRVATGAARSRDEVRELLRRTPVEPAFPATRGAGIGPLLTRMLSRRLGATALVSHLGALAGADLTAARFWPAASGPHGIAFGAVAAGGRTSLSVRARRGWFRQSEAAEILEDLTEELAGPAQ